MQNFLYVIALVTAIALYLGRSKKNILWKSDVAHAATSKPTGSWYYKEYFERSSEAIFIVEVLRSGSFRFEGLNPVAAQCIDPQGVGIQGRNLDEIANCAGDVERKHILHDLAAQLERTAKTGRPSQYEGKFSVEQDAGSNVYNFSLFPIVDDDGTRHILCFVRDISINKLYEKELQERIRLEERLTGFTANAPGFFYSYRHDLDGSNFMPFASAGTVQDIKSLKSSEQQLKETQDRLRELVISRESLREDERKRIAWELHEELGQLLAAMKMRMSSLRSRLQKNGLAQAEEDRAVIQLIDSSIRTVHEIVSELRPTVLFHGVAAALEWLVAKFNKHPGFECELKIEGEDGIVVSDEMTTLVFRITQEALENAKRHTSVTRVVVSWMSSKNRHRWAIQHDGTNLFAELSDNKSLTIFGMQERIAAFGGEMQVFSTFDRGTVIEALFPNS